MGTTVYIVAIVAFACATQADAARTAVTPRTRQLPCNSFLRRHLPHLFTHCSGPVCTPSFSSWTNWTSTGQLVITSNETCSSSRAKQYVRNRTIQSATCDSKQDIEYRYMCEPDTEQVVDTMSSKLGLSKKSLISNAPTTTTTPPRNSTASRGRRAVPCPSAAQQNNNRLTTCPLTATCGKKKRRRSALTRINEEVYGKVAFETLDPGIPVEAFVPSDVHNRGKRTSHCNERPRYMLFVWDLSGSIPETKFIEMKDLIKRIVRSLCGYIRVAMLTYSSEFNLEFCFNCHGNDRELIASAIDNVVYMGEMTHTAGATKCACEHMLSTECSWDNKLLVTDVIYVTDGHHNGPCEKELGAIVQCLHDSTKPNVATYVVAYGEQEDLLSVDEEGLAKLINNNREEHIFYIESSSMNKLKDRADEADLTPGTLCWTETYGVVNPCPQQ